MTEQDKDLPISKLLAAASVLMHCGQGLIEWARSPDQFREDVAGYAADPVGHTHPLGDEFDNLCDAIRMMHEAIGEPDSTDRLMSAARRFYEGDD